MGGIGGLVGGDGGVRVGKLGGVSGEGVIGAMGAAVVADMVGSVVGDTGVSDAMGGSWGGSDVTGAFGLQPRVSTSIRISATKAARFIIIAIIRLLGGNRKAKLDAERSSNQLVEQLDSNARDYLFPDCVGQAKVIVKTRPSEYRRVPGTFPLMENVKNVLKSSTKIAQKWS